MYIKRHDGQLGKITSVKFDVAEKLVISTAEDGLMYIHQIDRENIKKEAAYDPFEEVESLEYIPSDQLEQIRVEKWQEFYAQNPPYF